MFATSSGGISVPRAFSAERSAIAGLVYVVPRHVGADPAGRHSVGEHAVATVVSGDSVAQRIEGALARRVGTEQRLLAAVGGPAR